MSHERKVQQSRGLHKEQLHHLHRRHENHHARNAERREQHKEGDLRVVVVVHDAVIHNVAVKVVGLYSSPPLLGRTSQLNRNGEFLSMHLVLRGNCVELHRSSFISLRFNFLRLSYETAEKAPFFVNSHALRQRRRNAVTNSLRQAGTSNEVGVEAQAQVMIREQGLLEAAIADVGEELGEPGHRRALVVFT